MSPVVLFDLPSKDRHACWSPNVWKTRLVLNYKAVDYTTRWLELPEVAATLKALAICPNSDSIDYTLPVVCLENGEYIMDSNQIAHALEEHYPSPSLRLDAAVNSQVQTLLRAIWVPGRPAILPRLWRDVVSDGSREYFGRKRAMHFGGKSLTEIEREAGENAWEAMQEPLRELAGLLKANKGPFFLGTNVCYADLVVAAFLECSKRIGQDFYDFVLAQDQVYGKLYEACRTWSIRDDH